MKRIILSMTLAGISLVSCRTPGTHAEMASNKPSSPQSPMTQVPEPGTFDLENPGRHHLASSFIRLSGGTNSLQSWDSLDETISADGARELIPDNGGWRIEGEILRLTSLAPGFAAVQTDRVFRIEAGGHRLLGLDADAGLVFVRRPGDMLIVTVLHAGGQTKLSAVGREVRTGQDVQYENMFADVPCAISSGRIDCSKDTDFGQISATIAQDIRQVSAAPGRPGAPKPAFGEITINTSTYITYSADLLCDAAILPSNDGDFITCRGQTQLVDR